MVSPPARLDKLSFTDRETARPRMLTRASRELALMPRESATTMRVINHSRILAMDRMKVCRLFSTWLKRFNPRSSSLSKMALITRQMTSSKRANRMVFRASPQPPRSSWFTPVCTLFSRVSVSMVLVLMSPPPLSTWNNGSIEKNRRAKQRLCPSEKREKLTQRSR